VAQLRLCCDQAIRRLADLKRRDRWFGARWLAAIRGGCAKVVGVEHTWVKIATVAGIAAAVALTVCQAPYRVEAPFVIRTDDAVNLPAPFDGYLAEVIAEVGDTVEKGRVLLSLDKRDLLLEEAAATAELMRARRETEKARADEALADMQIAEATAEQARVRLDLVRYRLGQADLVAPFDGIVIEGDLRERIGAPLPKGETLYRMARMNRLYAELEVDEADIDDVAAEADGSIAFASHPQQTYPIRLTRIEPTAQPKAGKNIILVRATFSEGPQPWCRPGMSGIGKIDVGRRRLIWIFTHRTVDFVRLRLWW
jgi:RND family efflux transporter MFP subunit